MATLDRQDIQNALVLLFQADSTLYGQGKLIQEISTRWQEWENATVDRRNPYKLYLKAPVLDKVVAAMQRSDYMVTCEYRAEGRANDPEDAWKKLDDIGERIDYLIDNQMWSGAHLTSYYTNSEATVINMENATEEVDVVEEGNPSGWRAHLEGVITIEIQRLENC